MTAQTPAPRALDQDALPDWLNQLLDARKIDPADYRWQVSPMTAEDFLAAGALSADDEEPASPGAERPVVALSAGGLIDLLHGSETIEAALDQPGAVMMVIWGVRAPHTFPPAEPVRSPGQGAEEARSYQARIHDWMMHCFGPDITMNRDERSLRFLEEALELVQAAGLGRDTVAAMADYVYGRPKGDLAQEVGGVSVCLSALCTAQGIGQSEAEESELRRNWEKSDKIRAKHGTKPSGLKAC